MAETPSPEDSARYVLSVFNHHKIISGQGLVRRSFVLPFDEPGWQTSDREIGIKYACDMGWVEPGKNDVLVLTDAGFAEIRHHVAQRLCHVRTAAR
jgi:hypothetical protein